MENRCKHELSKARPAAGKTHGKAKAAAEEVLDDVHGRQVHQAKPKTSEQTDGEVENYDAGSERDVDVGGGEEAERENERKHKFQPDVFYLIIRTRKIT